ncbi:hypothetical protein KFE98_05100 [bacterium SCSIO 12741]|nr:hypothetical protein KFE98_05100 [bacterium SCSIO 12741]
MRIVKPLIDWFVFSNLYVALPVSALAWSTYLIFSIPVSVPVLAFIYCSTLFLYNTHRLVGLNQMDPGDVAPRHQWALDHPWVMRALVILPALGIPYFLYSTEVNFWWGLLVPALIALGYTVPIIRKKGKPYRLRDVPYAKIFLISFTVSYVTAILPLMNETGDLWRNEVALGHALARAFFILAITIPFDIRDYKFDEPAKLQTLPLLFGIQRAKRLSLLALVFFAGISFYLFEANATITIAYLLSAIATAWIIEYCNENSSEYYYSLLIEGTMIIQFLLILSLGFLVG